MLDNDIEKVTLEDIQRLIDDGEPETKTLEYKSQLELQTPDQRREFCADVSSLANASGGYLIVGVEESSEEESKGQATALRPIVGESLDDLKLRIENLVLDSIEPRVRIQLKQLDCENGFILVVRVPRGLDTPHMIRSSGRFYSRNSAGKYPLDVRQIRSAFLASETIEKKVRDWHNDRLARIGAGEGPLSMLGTGLLVLHLMPLGSFSSGGAQSVVLTKQKFNLRFPLAEELVLSQRPNLDGVLQYCATNQPGSTPCYVQWFRNGSVEAVRSSMVYDWKGRPTVNDRCARLAVSSIESILEQMESLQIVPPVVVLITLIGVKDAFLFRNGKVMIPLPEAPRVDRNILELPDIRLESYEYDLKSEMKPMFDALWNAFGLESCWLYDGKGNWNPGGQ